jgi:hypothetical protein
MQKFQCLVYELYHGRTISDGHKGYHSILHFTTPDGIARMTSVYFDVANNLLKYVKATQHSISTYNSLTLLLNVNFSLPFGYTHKW